MITIYNSVDDRIIYNSNYIQLKICNSNIQKKETA